MGDSSILYTAGLILNKYFYLSEESVSGRKTMFSHKDPRSDIFCQIGDGPMGGHNYWDPITVAIPIWVSQGLVSTAK